MISDHAYARFSSSLGARGLRLAGRLNVAVYRLTRGRLMGKVGRAPVLLLTTTGRRSGQRRTAPVLYLDDGGRFVVIGSNAGNARPAAWALNLRSHPAAEVEIRGRRRRVTARLASGDEREVLWHRMNEQYGGFEDYRARAARDIPVLVLEPA